MTPTMRILLVVLLLSLAGFAGLFWAITQRAKAAVREAEREAERGRP
jgi:Flp pilus assembly protein CpaB